jgi:Nitrogen regulatory protein P-II
MKRFEIICDITIEDELIILLDSIAGINGYTKISPAHGTGKQGPRRGDHVWPEENALFIVYLDDEYSEQLIEEINKKREQFPRNGIAGFITESAFDF